MTGAAARLGVVAVATAAAIAALAAATSTPWPALAFMGYAGAMGVASAVDLAEHRVPNRLLAVLVPGVTALFGVAAALESEWGSFGSGVGGGIALLLMFALIHLKSPESFGAGDVKIAFIVGLSVCWFGFDALVWLLVWTWVGLAAVGLPALARRGRGAAPMLPFVPIMSLASIVTILLAA